MTPGLGKRLILEISEGSAMLLPEVVIRFMAEMQPKGVSFALDDFGAGLIAFRHLKDFLFDCVKVDRVFVAGIDESPDNQVLAEALVTVAHQFEMFAVAEGVETQAALDILAGAGCDEAQGYLFGRPMAAGDFLTWCRDSHHAAPMTALRAGASLVTDRGTRGGQRGRAAWRLASSLVDRGGGSTVQPCVQLEAGTPPSTGCRLKP